MPRLDFWYDFASTYSYLAAMRIERLAAVEGVFVRWRPFLLGPIFAQQGLTTSPFNLNEAKGRNMWRDLERQSADEGLPFKKPDPFPQASLLAVRVALLGTNEEWVIQFSRAVFTSEFGQGADISSPDTLGPILEGLGLDAADVLARAQTQEHKDWLKAQCNEAMELGIYGAPTFITESGELFWGNDRIEQALRWAKKAQ